MKANPFFKKIFRAILIPGVIAALLSGTNVFAAGGTLDPTFGTNGVLTALFHSRPTTTWDIILQPDGRIITLGTNQSVDNQDKKIIVRYNSNGTLDTFFGDNGIMFVEVESFSGSKIALQPDGKLIVGGLSGGKFAAIRYNSNGTRDTSFGTSGMANLRFTSEAEQSLADVLIQPDGKIVMVGSHTLGQSNFTDFLIARFNSNGTPDETFVANGFQIIDDTYFPNNRYNYAKGGVIQPDGKIIMSGNMMDNDGKNQLSMARVNADGSLDTAGFGSNGKGTVISTFSNFQNYNLNIQADGKILVLGSKGSSKDGDLTIVRYSPNGSLDTSFGGSGIVATDFGAEEQPDDLVIQPDGKIVVAGVTTTVQASSDFLLARYNSDGSLDTSFGSSGKVTTDFGNDINTSAGIVLQPDNKFIFAGNSGDTTILARYETGSSTTAYTFNSVSTQDGWILESAEFSNKGGTLDRNSTLIYLGDDAKDRQYRSILSFDTEVIPDNATVTAAQVKIKRQGVVGTDPFNTHGTLLLEIRNGTFSNDLALNLGDFSALANAGSTQDKFASAGSSWYTVNLSNTNLGLVNKTGTTQFRMLFTRDDNDNMRADYAKIFSGNAASDMPQLIVTYSTGGGPGNHAPVITSNGGGITASINVSENSTAVTTVTATDADGQAITYSISGADAGKFTINSGTGVLTFVTAPDFESIPTGTVYHVTVQASDGSLSASQDISVTVTPVNEFAPVISSNGGGATANISLPENTSVATTVTANDADLPLSLTYSVAGGADAALFSINSSDGTLSFVTAPIYNTPNDAGLDHVYNVTVQASDGALTASQELVISITNPNPVTGGMLDSTFGSNGIVAMKFNDIPSSTKDVILQADGKIVVLGERQSTKIIARYNSNGALDTSFGTNGIATIDFPSFFVKKLALQTDGKLIVAGQQRGFAVVRYNSNGTLDTSFGTNGMGGGVAGSEDELIAEDVAVQPDGKIVVAGSFQFHYSNHIDYEIVRFNSDGSRDAVNTIDWGDFPSSRYNWGKAVAIQPDNKIVMSGDMIIEDVDRNDISLARLTPDLRTDRSTFGTNGKGTVISRLDYFQHSSGALALQPDGKIVVAGTIFNGDMNIPQNLALARFNNNGTLDSTFGGTGIVITDLGAEESTAGLVIQASGKIIVAGTTTSAGASDFLLVRYNSDGSLDSSFGANGKVISDLGNASESVSGIAQQVDGKVVVSGISGENAVLARYDTGSSVSSASFTFDSVGSHDGWVLESGEFSNKGGTLDRTADQIYVGDDAKDRQYRGFLSFNTASIPDNVTITSAQVRIKKHSMTGADPFTTHGNLLLEIRDGTFSNDIALTVDDFSAAANVGSTQDKFSAADGGWFAASLSGVNTGLINKYGTTQFRLMFGKDDNDDLGADYVKFLSGNAAGDLPQLVVTYSTSGGTNTQPPVIYGGAALSISIPENTITVGSVSAMDPDGQPVTYSIAGADAGRFSINPTTGILTFVTAPDYEAIPSGTVYHVTAQASDGSLTSTQDIAVTVTPVNEFAPVVTSSNGEKVLNVNVPEGTLDATTIAVTDADLPAQTIEYVFPSGGADDFLFTMDQATGKLSFLTPPVYNAPNDAGLDHVYNVKFEISDGELSVPLEVIISVINPNPPAGFTVLHQFGSQPDNGRVPYGVLVPYNGVFYGTTTYGGPPYDVPPTNPANKGNIFRMNMDGTGFTVLHEFFGGNNDGWKPWSGLSILGDTIYGTTVYGGPHGESGGMLYEMNINGGRLGPIHAFGDPGDGFGGSTSPTLVGDTLYGMTRWGGNGTGTIYRHNLSTEDYTQLYRFAANGSDGSSPLGTLTAANDGYLYGLTWLGGRNNMGTLFRIKPDSSALETLYHFAGGTQGKYPYDSLAFDGEHTLYGTTLGEYGVNLSDLGTIFKYDISSKTYSVLHKFAGGANDSGKPNGSVVLSSDGVTLYGTTHGDDAWGGREYGILYQMNVDGTGFTQLHEFKGGADGATPMRTPLFINGALYGMTAYGGSENYGLIYRFQVAEAGMSQRALAAPIINAASPTFTSEAAISATENTLALTTVTAADADVPAQTLTYSITGGADASLFSINPSTGELVFAAAPDYEVPADSGSDNIYNLTVQVSDGVTAATQDLAITITSANDNSPVITSGNAISIAENTTAVTTVTASDADLPAQALNYSIIGGADSARFIINPTTGELAFAAPPDYEVPTDVGSDNIYNVNIQASDGELFGSQEIAVTVTGVNDNAPSITSESNLSILENGMVVTIVTAIDADLPSQTLTYSIAGGADSTLFAVNSSTGELTFTAAPDFETQKDAGTDNVYNVTVQASDGQLAVAQDIAVTVTPVNDNLPVITSPAGFSISENATTVGAVTATDADLPAQPLTYSIIGGADSALFTVDASTGALNFVTARDYEAPNDAGSDNVYNLTIQASDGALTVTQDLAVTILPVNDNTPVITSPDKFSVPENTVSIATLAATDADRPAQPLTYSITGGADVAKFSIVNTTGELKFIAAPDFEAPADANLDNIYEIVLQVSDGVSNSTKNLAVQVIPKTIP